MTFVRRIAFLAALAGLGTPSGALTVQENASDLFFDVSTGLEFYDNYESLRDPLGNTTLWGTDFVLGYDSETRNEDFSFRAGARYEYGDFAEDPSRSSQWINPFASLRYDLEARSSFFKTDLSYRELDNGINFRKGFDSSTDLIVDQGTRSDTRAGIEIGAGLGTPVWGKMDLGYHERRFFDTTSPDLTNQDTIRAEAEVGLELTRTTTLLFVGGYHDRNDIDDIKDDETHTSIGVGLEMEPSANLKVRGVLRYERDERSQGIGEARTTRVKEAPTLDLSLVQDRPNGNLRFSLLGELDSNGVRQTAKVGRELETRAGGWDVALGATLLADGQVTPVGSLEWDREYSTRLLVARLDSSVRTDDDGDNFLRNNLAVRFAQELTDSDGLELTANLYSSDRFDGGDDFYRQAGASVSYFREINRQLSFVTGYRHSRSADGGNDDDNVTENKVFARFDKRFSLRP